MAAVADLDVVLYGAYGCVGHFAAFHLANQSDLSWAIAGRNETKLHALAAALAPYPSGRPEVIVAPLTGDLTPWVSRTKAIATAAGPFSIHEGENLVASCAKLGVHYADTSDEFYWQRRMIERYDTTAKASGARLSLASGFCALAGDLGAALALDALPVGQPAKVDAWLERYSGGVSAGVIATTHINASYPKAWATDPYVLAPNVPTALRRDTLVEGMRFPAVVRGEGLLVPNLFGPYDARLMRRSFVRRNQTVALRAGATPTLYAEWLALILRHPSAWGSLTTCPADVLMRDGSWRYRVIARTSDGLVDDGHADSHDDDASEPASKAAGAAATVVLSGSGDPGYHFTALALSETALCLAGKLASGVKCRGAFGGGVLTPALAVDVDAMRTRLESIGLLHVEVTKGEVRYDDNADTSVEGDDGRLARDGVDVTRRDHAPGQRQEEVARLLDTLGQAETESRRAQVLDVLLEKRP